MKSVAISLLFLASFGREVLPCQVQPPKQDLDWWKTSVLYQIYPRSFKDSDGNGIGDLKGITSKLQHIKDIGADALWLSPIFTSPQKDMGYDISNFTNIDPTFGTLADFDQLMATAKRLKLKVLLDFVPNHSSDEHEWFQKSVKGIKPYDDYYIWKNGINVNGVMHPPNNWLSVFGGSAWTWNEQRRQYYYHAFLAEQPDLNYHNANLKKEMENVISFWMQRGVDGFRVDAVNHMFEDTLLRDEPPSSNAASLPSDDYESLSHVYTRDLDGTYEVVDSWQKLMDNYVKTHRTDGKFMILEVYSTVERAMKYYTVGANPFNFMFIASLNNGSKAVDFKNTIDNWLKEIPTGKVANWVVGNHDNHRASTRYGEYGRSDQTTMLCSVLPGITVVYNGDEIGMRDRPFTYQETVDPSGCNAGPNRYQVKSRDPERTPFQWDGTTSAGFSSNPNTWLPVHPNYKQLNLQLQTAPLLVSHYNVFKNLTALKKQPVLQKGTVELLLVTDQVLAVVRRLQGQQSVVLLINFNNDRDFILDLTESIKPVSTELKVYTASVESQIIPGTIFKANNLHIPKAASLILLSSN
ncbi:maltase 1-like [Trichogramma pretiosum]|uniref:maltase 1-like n=1 Tax=Trichogramma pretiosum TaxID=7493 RepID=UPI0006C9AF3F|nr:maltase 1-like [Trichogramma pretiosum]